MVDNHLGFNSEILDNFRTYEDYLDSLIKPEDLYYFKDREIIRQLVELGHNGNTVDREEFERRKAAAETFRLASKRQVKKLAHAGNELKDNFLRALAEREEANRSGKMTSIIFMRVQNSNGHGISGYIDYSHRLKSEDFRPYFSGKKRLLPRPSDLSFYNWVTQAVYYNVTSNYDVITNNPKGMFFKSKSNGNLLNVEPEASPGDGSIRIPIESETYDHVVIYDTIIRRPCAPQFRQ